MSLVSLATLIGISFWLGTLPDNPLRQRVLLALSVSSLFYLQPATPLRLADFWLPLASLALVVLVWAVTRPKAIVPMVELRTFGWMAGVVGLVWLTRRLPLEVQWIARPVPALWSVLLVLATLGIILTGAKPRGRLESYGGAILGTIVGALFFTLKFDPLAQHLSRVLRGWAAQSPAFASPVDLSWLGFSYLAFRILHTIIERRQGRLPVLSLGEYATYALFFPALPAGPIDRVGRFVEDLRAGRRLRAQDAFQAGRRLLLGAFKKFVLADSLALLALNEVNAAQATQTGWLWLFLYAFAFRIYWDFSGYTDIAIGLGRLVGVQLPENFERPYTRGSLGAFWRHWHQTLAEWFRFYLFNPLTRALRRAKRLPAWAIILIGQLSTMALIGIWHGVRWNFLIWGIWHGAGLFLHNRWRAFWTARQASARMPGWLQRSLAVLGVGLTFHYVLLGWVWFALPDPGVGLRVFRRLLLGGGG